MFSLIGHTDYIKTLLEVPETSFIISASSDCTIRIWDLHSQLAKCIVFTQKRMHHVLYCNKLSVLIVFEEDGYVSVYPLMLHSRSNPRKLYYWRAARTVSAVCLSEETSVVVVIPSDILIWSVSGELKQTIKRTDKLIINAVCCQDSRLYGGDGTGKLIVIPYK